MKLIHTTLIVFTGFLFSHALYAQVSTNEAPVPADTSVTQQAGPVVLEQPASSNATVTAAVEAPVSGEAATTSVSPSGTPFGNSPYPIILEKMPFGRPPDVTALNAAATSMDEAKMKVEQEKLASTFSWTAINITPDGRTAIGFTDLSAKPPANYYMTVGESANNWKVVEADYTSETATIEKDGVRISLKFGNKSPIAPTTPGAPPASPSPLGTPAITTMSGLNHGLQPGGTPPIIEAHTVALPAGGATPLPLASATSASHSALLTSYRDRLNERLKAQENQKLETDRKQKEELSKLVTVSITDALRKQQEETAAAAQQQQPQGETPAPQVQPVEVPVQ
jgi:hypothetical protein